MASSACLPALLLAAGVAAIAAPRLGLRPAPWSAKARARMQRVATAALIGSFAVALALSLVGVNGGTVERAIQIGVLVAMAVAAVVIWRSSGAGPEPL